MNGQPKRRRPGTAKRIDRLASVSNPIIMHLRRDRTLTLAQEELRRELRRATIRKLEKELGNWRLRQRAKR